MALLCILLINVQFDTNFPFFNLLEFNESEVDKKNMFLHIPLFLGKDRLGFEIYIIHLSSFQFIFRLLNHLMEEPNARMSYFFNTCASWYVKRFDSYGI